jgi:hypothetical protein
MNQIQIEGPYRPTRKALITSAIVHALALIFIGGLLALSFVGAAGWL